MFLSILNGEEKENFLNLLINTANIDGDFSENEKEKINAYVLEMGLTLKDHNQYSKSNSELISRFKESSDSVKKAVFMEITALMLADGMHEAEEKLLQYLQSEFDFSEGYKIQITDWYNKIMPLYNEGFSLIGDVK